MTCEEFCALTDRDPEECTVAERAAVVRHADQCPACRKEIRKLSRDAERIIPKEQLRRIDCEVRELVKRDLTDPEGYLSNP